MTDQILETPELTPVDPEPNKAAYESIDMDDIASTAVKALDDSGKIGGYLIVWGSPDQRDLSSWPNKDGSKGEYFTKATELNLDWFEQRPALYHHGLDKDTKTTLIGTIDSIKMDDIGLWATAQINKRNRYAKAVEQLVKDGKLSWSSGTLPHLAERGMDGQIKRWPLIEGSLTPTPAEPRFTHISSAKAIGLAFKALNLPVDRLGIEQDDTLGSGQETAQIVNAPVTPAPAPFKSTPVKETPMEPTLQEQIAAAIKAQLAEQAEAERLAAEAQAATEARINAEVDKRLAERASKTLPAGNRLPLVPVAKQPEAIKSVQVGEDRRYAGLSSEDMSFLTDVYSFVLSTTPAHKADNSMYRLAHEFMNSAANDENRTLQRQICAKALQEHKRGELPDSTLEFLPYKSLDKVWANDYDSSAREAAIKANELDNAAQTAYGLEWVPTIWSGNIWRRVRMNNPVAANMQTIEMPSNPYNIPIEGTDPTVYNVAEGTDLTQLVLTSANTMTLSKVGTGKNQMTAAKLGTRVGFSSELVEDSIIPILPMFRAQIQRALENYIDDTIINGDTATGASVNVNLSDGTPTAGTSWLAFDGLRKYGLVTNTAQKLDAANATPSISLMRNTRKLLSKQYGIDLANLLYIVNWETYLKMLNMPEYATWQHLGMAGSAVTGLLPNGSSSQVGQTSSGPGASPVGVIDGIPVYVSAQLAQSESTGKQIASPSATLFGSAILFHRSRWLLGYRRAISMDMFPQTIFSDTYQIWATVRCTIKSFDTTSAAILYDIQN